MEKIIRTTHHKSKQQIKQMIINDIISSLKIYSRYKITGLPNTANYDITSRCNSDCIMCYFKKNYTHKENELSIDTWKNILKSHNTLGIKNAFITGGEPLLRLDIIKEVDNIFEKVWIISNGIIKLPDNINRRVFISLDGTRDIHNTIRNVNSFDTILKNISKDNRVIITTTLNTQNYNEIRNMIEIARGADVHGITFSLCTGTENDDPLVLKEDKLENVIRELKYVLKHNKDIVLLTDKMIDNFKHKKHINRCMLKGKWVVSFYPSLQIKEPCVLGENVACSTCGCIVPVIMDAILYQFDFDGLDVIKRMYPANAFVKRIC